MLHWLATLDFVCIKKLKLPSDLAQVGDIQLSEKSVSRVVSRWWKRNRSASDFLCVPSMPRQLRLVTRLRSFQLAPQCYQLLIKEGRLESDIQSRGAFS